MRRLTRQAEVQLCSGHVLRGDAEAKAHDADRSLDIHALGQIRLAGAVINSVDEQPHLSTSLVLTHTVSQQAIRQGGLVFRELHGHGPAAAGITSLHCAERRLSAATTTRATGQGSCVDLFAAKVNRELFDHANRRKFGVVNADVVGSARGVSSAGSTVTIEGDSSAATGSRNTNSGCCACNHVIGGGCGSQGSIELAAAFSLEDDRIVNAVIIVGRDSD